MKEAIVLNKADIKKIIAVYYGVEESCVLASQYSFTVIKESDKEIKLSEKVVHKSGT